jgi:hypothetical protein
VEHPRDPFDLVLGLRDEMAELRVTVGQLATQVADIRTQVVDFRQEVRSDIRRLDDRIFQLMLLQLGTLATALAAIVTAVLT